MKNRMIGRASLRRKRARRIATLRADIRTARMFRETALLVGFPWEVVEGIDFDLTKLESELDWLTHKKRAA